MTDDDVPYEAITPEMILESSKKLLRISRGEEDPDERDSLEYRRIYPFYSLLRERVDLDADNVLRSTAFRVAKQKSLKSVKVNHFDKYVTGLIQSPLSLPLEEINPLHTVEQSRRITQLGPGGLAAESITEEANNIHPSEFGFLSPLEGPESEKIGVDTRMAIGTQIGSDGRLYQKFRNKRTGYMEWLSPKDTKRKTIGLPD